MPLTSSNAVKQLSDGNSQGTVLGQSSSDPIAFYGATPVARQSATETVSTVLATSVSAAIQSSTAFGVSSQAQMNAIPTAINALITDVTAIRGFLASTNPALLS